MAHGFSATTTINKPIDEVFTFLAAGENDKKFSPRVQEIRRTTDGPPGVGTVFETTVKDSGMTSKRQFELTEEGIPRAHQLDTSGVNVNDPRRVTATTDAERLTPRVVGHRAAIVLHTVTNAGAIDGDNVALILDRASARQDVPVHAAPLRPVRNQQRRVDVWGDSAE